MNAVLRRGLVQHGFALWHDVLAGACASPPKVPLSTGRRSLLFAVYRLPSPALLLRALFTMVLVALPAQATRFFLLLLRAILRVVPYFSILRRLAFSMQRLQQHFPPTSPNFLSGQATFAGRAGAGSLLPFFALYRTVSCCRRFVSSACRYSTHILYLGSSPSVLPQTCLAFGKAVWL